MKNVRMMLLMTVGALAGGLLLTAACQQMQVDRPPNTAGVQDKDLPSLKKQLIANSSAFYSLRADCEALLRTPLVTSPPELRMRGELLIAKPRKIYLKLSDAGMVFIKLIGNGKEYVVKMPIYSQECSGEYDEPLMPVSGRVHFLPDDMADAMDVGPVLASKIQVLKSYPRRWEILPGAEDKPIVYPATWAIDSTVLTKAPESAVKVANSIIIDRTTEQVLQLDKFRPDGSLRTRIWMLKAGIARSSGEVSARVPEELLIWYPHPLEGTIIRLRLTGVKLNVKVPEDAFSFDQ